MNINKVTKKENIVNKILKVIFERPVQMAFYMDYFQKYRDFSDGVDLITIELDVNFVGYHAPQKHLFIGLLNFVIIDMRMYNVLDEVIPVKKAHEDPTDKVME